jgi:predicted RNA-binding Zn-ribbon protein involved in translation (DUF1610 family)
MKIEDLEKVVVFNRNELEIDPVPVVENNFFGKKGDYREKTINFLIEKRINFSTSFNIVFEFVRRYVAISCPVCGKKMVNIGGGGNSDSLSISFECAECKTVAHLNLPHHGLAVDFKKE